MNVRIQKAWVDMLRSEIETSRRQKTQLFASRIESTPPASIRKVTAETASLLGARATVINSAGTVLADSEADADAMENHATRPEFVAALHGKLGSDVRNSHTLGIPFLYVATPVPAGAVRMAYPLAVLQQAERQVRNALIKSSAVAVLIAILFALIATQSLGRRLRRITEFAERVAAGDLSARIQENSTDEIAHVATALDKTARKLEDGFRALENSRQTLETLLNSMQEAVLAVSSDSRVLWANQRMERLLPGGVRL